MTRGEQEAIRQCKEVLVKSKEELAQKQISERRAVESSKKIDLHLKQASRRLENFRQRGCKSKKGGGEKDLSEDVLNRVKALEAKVSVRDSPSD